MNEDIDIFIVVSCWLEDEYASESSFRRYGYSCTLHDTHNEAIDKAIQETHFCLLPSQLRIYRNCGVVAARVPLRLVSVNGQCIRWVSDRMPELARRAELFYKDDPEGAIDMAFFALGEGGKATLNFLQSALIACRVFGEKSNALRELLLTVSTMSPASAMSLKPSIMQLYKALSIIDDFESTS